MPDGSTEAPLNAAAIAEQALALSDLLRLRTLPIGMKLFADAEEMAFSPRALRSAVFAQSATPISMCEICTVARETTAIIGTTTIASAARTVRVVASPLLSLLRSRLCTGVNR